MNSHTLDLILIIFATFFVVADIILALCLGISLPLYVVNSDWFYASEYKLNFSEAVVKCPCLYDVFPYGTNISINFDKIHPETVFVPAPEEKWRRYPFLVTAFMNTSDGPRFGCSGVIFNKRTVLLSSKCNVVLDESENIIIHTKTSFQKYMPDVEHWRGDGVFVPASKHFLNLYVKHQFPKNLLPKPKLIKNEHIKNFSYAIEVGWENVSKDEPFEDRIWTTKNPPSNLQELCSNYSTEYTTRVLFTNCHKIISMYWNAAEICKKYLAYVMKPDPTFTVPKCDLKK